MNGMYIYDPVFSSDIVYFRKLKKSKTQEFFILILMYFLLIHCISFNQKKPFRTQHCLDICVDCISLYTV